MVQIGKFNRLKILRDVSVGLFLDGGRAGEILLPVRYLPDDYEVGTSIEVFVCYDSEDRLMATTEKPYAQVGEFAALEVVAMNSVGAFLDWGLPKNLLLPFAEQSRSLNVGDHVVVHVYLDKSDRIAASMRIEKHLDKQPAPYEQGQMVDLLIVGRTDLGFKAVIQGHHIGVLYENEVFQKLHYGQRIQGFIKKVRPDGKIDLSLQRPGYGAAGDIAPRILELLQKNGGFLDINDKTPAERIYKLFGVSKKKYKMALGGLYKNKLISVNDEGIRLLTTSLSS